MVSATTKIGGRLALLLLAAVLMAGQALAQRTVTLRLNTATLPDTTGTADGLIQVRGQITNQDVPFTLPDGNVISWDDQTTLKPMNVGGDYWEISFQIPDNEELQFKFFSAQAEATGIGGWEDGGNHVLAAGTGDTTLVLHFFEKGFDTTYAWRPWEQKPDTVAVWFRVYVSTEEGAADGYDPNADNIVVGVRGDPLNGAGPLDWGTTKVILQRESSDKNMPGYHLFSGVAYYPASLAGTTQEYKFFIEPNGWEEGNLNGNRSFVIPDSDTTLHWVYYGNTKPVDLLGQQRVTAQVIFTVDIDPLVNAGLFDKQRGDTIIVRGDFNGWGNCLEAGNPDDCALFESVDPTQYTTSISITNFPNTQFNYKFYVDFEAEGWPDGWEEPLDYGGSNRRFVFTGEDPLNLGVQFFNDVREGNVIPEGTQIDVTFQVDMSPALNFQVKRAFDPEKDSVYVVFEDPLWRLTQALPLGLSDLEPLLLSDPDGDLIYTGTITVTGPTYNGIGFRYRYGNVLDGYVDEGEGGFDPGRRRYQYILPSAAKNWPTEYTMPLVQFQESGLLPFECNPTADVASLPQDVQDLCYPAGTSPTAVEPIDGTRPERFALSRNYPNPFADRTTFEYTLPETQPVRVRVYDLLGRVVATLVDEVQPAGTYRVTFRADGLSSGIYVYRLETPSGIFARKMMIVR
ncbi:T9SS type A sorting domain-containing protein [Rhodothermus marinus]|uniref:T9SS type A sorting domain-containing protein n=1 Tax=Rhodothermus marinus TaxID=29549 RepID=UPI0037C5BAD8